MGSGLFVRRAVPLLPLPSVTEQKIESPMSHPHARSIQFPKIQNNPCIFWFTSWPDLFPKFVHELHRAAKKEKQVPDPGCRLGERIGVKLALDFISLLFALISLGMGEASSAHLSTHFQPVFSDAALRSALTPSLTSNTEARCAVLGRSNISAMVEEVLCLGSSISSVQELKIAAMDKLSQDLFVLVARVEFYLLDSQPQRFHFGESVTQVWGKAVAAPFRTAGAEAAKGLFRRVSRSNHQVINPEASSGGGPVCDMNFILVLSVKRVVLLVSVYSYCCTYV